MRVFFLNEANLGDIKYKCVSVTVTDILITSFMKPFTAYIGSPSDAKLIREFKLHVTCLRVGKTVLLFSLQLSSASSEE